MLNSPKKIFLCLFMMIVLSVASTAFAQGNNLTRQYVPVVINGEKFPALDFPMARHYYAYKFNAAAATWTAIPFQFDELDENGLFVLKGDSLYDDKVDANDQLIFMPENIGDRALTSDWLADAGAQNASRIEIELTDPSDPTRKGWIYLFKALQNPPSLDNSVEYIDPPGIDTAADTIKAANYTLGHNANGWMDYAVIHGPNASDLLDRIKLHLRGKLDLGALGKFPYDLNESANLDSPRVHFQNGPVRAFRKYTVNFVLPPLIEESFSYIMAYSPYSTYIGTQGINLSDSTIKQYLPMLGLQSLRQSVDLSENAKGMRFYNPANSSGIPIDGVPDVVNDQIALSPERAWMLATGTNGTLISMIQVPPIGDHQSLYYFDDVDTARADYVLPDSTRDTGDGLSVGDMGVLFSIGDSLAGLVISIDLSFFFLPPTDNPMALGENLRQWADQPLDAAVIEQTRTPVSVADPSHAPNVFALYDVYPNPFDLQKGSARFRFSTGPETGPAVIRIFNTLGQEVQRFERSQSKGQSNLTEFSWDGRDFNGRLLPAGVYLYRLEAGNKISTKKLLMLR